MQIIDVIPTDIFYEMMRHTNEETKRAIGLTCTDFYKLLVERFTQLAIIFKDNVQIFLDQYPGCKSLSSLSIKTKPGGGRIYTADSLTDLFKKCPQLHTFELLGYANIPIRTQFPLDPLPIMSMRTLRFYNCNAQLSSVLKSFPRLTSLKWEQPIYSLTEEDVCEIGNLNLKKLVFKGTVVIYKEIYQQLITICSNNLSLIKLILPKNDFIQKKDINELYLRFKNTCRVLKTQQMYSAPSNFKKANTRVLTPGPMRKLGLNLSELSSFSLQQDHAELNSLSVNCNGSAVSMLCETVSNQLQSITTLKIQNATLGLSISTFAFTNKIGHIRKLSFTVTNGCYPALASFLNACPNLVSCELINTCNLTPGDVFDWEPPLRLRVLKIKNGGEGFPWSSFFKYNSQLKVVHIVSTPFSRKRLKNLYKRLPSLQEIYIKNNVLYDHHTVESFLNNSEKLVKLGGIFESWDPNAIDALRNRYPHIDFE